MQYSDILKEANLLRGAKIDAVLGKWFINEGMQVLATDYDSACKRNNVALTVPVGTWTDLPAGCLAIIECSASGTPYETYEMSFGQIRTLSSDALTLDLTYLTAHPDVVADSDAPGVHELYHRPLALFMAARDRQRVFADEDSDSVRLMAEFASIASRVNTRLTTGKKTRRVLAVAVFR